MTKQEFGRIVAMMKAIFTDPKFLPDEVAISAWYRYFKDDAYDTVMAAVDKYISGNDRTPMPSNIRSCMASSAALNEEQAWDKVVKAIRDSLWHSEERFEELPDVLKRCVGSPSQLRQWGSMDSSELHTVEKSHFLRTYRGELEREKQTALIPQGMRIGAEERIGIEGRTA